MKVRRWAALTVALYALTFALLTGPVLFSSFAFGRAGDRFSPADLIDIYTAWEYWAIVSGLTFLQALFLLAPLDVARERPKRRGPWITLALVSGLLMALLVGGLYSAIVEAFTRGKFEDFFQVGLGLALAGWALWGGLFYSYLKSDAASGLSRVIDRMLDGSVAELLVAVPCHVYARHQDYCCAGFGTFFGIAAGLSVLGFAFGPGVFFLFVKRVRRLQRAQADEALPAEVPENPVSRTHARDALLWSTAAFAFLFSSPLLSYFEPQSRATEQFWQMSVFAFLVMNCAAFRHAVRAYSLSVKRPRWLIYIAAALFESILLVAWWGLR
ncbi:MAG TPA: hypothetical protein VEK08_14170 [Planctomycetota bacterium]|nr:hypothetical protein [Planctomycetota bacterium]